MAQKLSQFKREQQAFFIYKQGPTIKFASVAGIPKESRELYIVSTIKNSKRMHPQLIHLVMKWRVQGNTIRDGSLILSFDQSHSLVLQFNYAL